jgi:NAD(P)H dehydrogenase (quinone)
MTAKRLLISGATGSTGRNAVETLIKQGFAVRALVHGEDRRSEHLRALGAEVVVADLLSLDDARHALEGIEAAYFVYPIAPRLIEATVYFAQAAREAEVRSIVNMSQISARRDSKSQAARDHWVAERLLDRSGIPVTHLRPTFFAQNFLHPVMLGAIAQRGVISFPFGDGRHAPIAAEDQARLIAAILADPGPHQGKTYSLQGPREMDYFEIAEALSEALGRKIHYQPADIDAWREQARLPPFLVQHLCGIAPGYREGLFGGTDTIIEKVTGKAPMTFKDYLVLNQDALAAVRTNLQR